ncbi:MAG: low temperature requirement protein A [Pseudomonadota bacterium]
MIAIDWMRQRDGHDSSKVTMVELFFDLIFVFAVTQLSHGLIENQTLEGGLHTVLLFMAVWWLWIFTSWITNWLNPETLAVRLMLFALMLGGLLMSASIPEAFGAKGWIVGSVFAAMQVGRTLFMLLATRTQPRLLRNFQRILIWLCASGLCWIAGGFAQPELRVAWWLAALAIEYVSPFARFWVPGLGRSQTSDWNIDGAHMAERCMLFVIIALGESILVTGATFAKLPPSASTLSVFVACFVGSLAMWWVYFDSGAERATHRITHSEDPGRIARLSYNYLHLPIIFGIIVCAVADEIVLLHPDHADTFGIAVIMGGPAIYLLGNALFKWVSNDRALPPLSHLAGLLLLGIATVLAITQHYRPMNLSFITTGIMVLVAIWESRALRRK